eukprot:431805_1
MSSENTLTYDCLCIKITTATFAQPRSYFLTAQCIHKDTNIDDSINESIPKYRTAASKSTKTPQFNSKKPFLLKLPNDIELSQVFEEYKVVFEAYAIVSSKENSNNKEAKLMGENILILSNKKQLLNKESIDEVITLEGVLKIDETEKRVPVGQASITMKIQQITETMNQNTSKTTSKNTSKTTPNNTQSFQIQSPLTVKWPAVKHSNSIMIQINRWWGNNIDLWPESFIHIIHRICGEVVTATHQKAELLNFFEILELPLDINENTKDTFDNYEPFKFNLIDESSRQIIESFTLPSTCLSVLHQYDFLLLFGEESNINLECCIWFNPNRQSMLNILNEEKSMIIIQIGLNEMK